ncbi:Aquaporin [Aphelenchoides besseyi]|nr:Aquaporin [Aphelenchoides besseyi]
MLLIGCFMIRLLITKVPENYKRFIVPVIFGSFLSFALTYVGIPALNPVTTSSRLLNCPGLDIQAMVLDRILVCSGLWLAIGSGSR